MNPVGRAPRRGGVLAAECPTCAVSLGRWPGPGKRRPLLGTGTIGDLQQGLLRPSRGQGWSVALKQLILREVARQDGDLHWVDVRSDRSSIVRVAPAREGVGLAEDNRTPTPRYPERHPVGVLAFASCGRPYACVRVERSGRLCQAPPPGPGYGSRDGHGLRVVRAALCVRACREIGSTVPGSAPRPRLWEPRRGIRDALRLSFASCERLHACARVEARGTVPGSAPPP